MDNGPVHFPPAAPLVELFGPRIVAAFAQAILTGIIVNQSFRFWSHGEKETRVVNACAALVTLVTVTQTSLTFYNVWMDFVVNFGNLASIFPIYPQYSNTGN